VKWKQSLKRYLFPRVTALLTPGPDGRTFCKRYGALDSQIFETGYPIDVEYFRRKSVELRPQREILKRNLGLTGMTFLYVGRFWSGKGLDFLLDAFAAIRRHGLDVSLLLVGDGVDEAHLRSRCAHESIDRVVFQTFLQHDQLPEAYAASDVFVFPTLGDPYGLVVDEAMASGLPIISSANAGDISQRVLPSINGIIVPQSDFAALAEAMRYMVQNRERLSGMGAFSYNTIRHNSHERWASLVENAIYSMVGLNGNTSDLPHPEPNAARDGN